MINADFKTVVSITRNMTNETLRKVLLRTYLKLLDKIKMKIMQTHVTKAERERKWLPTGPEREQKPRQRERSDHGTLQNKVVFPEGDTRRHLGDKEKQTVPTNGGLETMACAVLGSNCRRRKIHIHHEDSYHNVTHTKFGGLNWHDSLVFQNASWNLV